MNESALRHIPLFERLDSAELSALESLAVRRKVFADTMILRADEEGDTLFVILSGRVTVSMHSDEGKEVILSILKDGEFFGEISLLDGEPRSASITATEDTELLLLRRADFLDCLARFPDMVGTLLASLACRLRRTNRQVESLALLNSYGRVAGVLLQLAEDQGIYQSDGSITITERPILQEIAGLAGTSRETVSRILNNLEQNSYIERDGRKIQICDPDRLQDDFFFIL